MTAEQPIELAPYDVRWLERYERERRLLEGVLAPWLDGGIHHVGSTAVPGLAAKPVVDIMAGVKSLEESRAAFGPLEEHEYCYFPYRTWMHWFCKPSPSFRTHHLHLMERSHPEWEARLAFRDHLREHPETAAEYEALKLDLAVRYRDDREAYTDAKGDFVRAVVERALSQPRS